MKLLLTTFLLTLTQLSFSQTDTGNIIFQKGDYKIQYPHTWRVDTSKLMGTEFFLLAPLDNETDKFRENVSVIIQDLTGQHITLEKYKEITDNQITDFVTDPKVFESTINKATKNDFFRIVYAMTQGKARLKITSICFIKNDKAYLITFTTEFDKYEQYKKIGQEILNTFTLTK